MLRILIVLLASSDALAIMPSSKPALQPVSMHKRIQTLLHSPSRSALADVLHGPYPPDACPAYQRVVHGALVVAILWRFSKYLFEDGWQVILRLLCHHGSRGFCSAETLLVSAIVGSTFGASGGLALAVLVRIFTPEYSGVRLRTCG